MNSEDDPPEAHGILLMAGSVSFYVHRILPFYFCSYSLFLYLYSVMKKFLFTVAAVVSLMISCTDPGFTGRKVLFGTPEGYAQRLAEAIEAAGGIPVSVPFIETVIPEDNAALDSLFKRIDSYDYIAFSSRKAIEAFFSSWDEENESDLPGIKFCAIGKDADLLREHGINPDIIPDDPSPAGIIQSLSSIRGIENMSVAVIVPELRGITEPNIVPDFIRGLQELGMDVTRVNAYRTGPAVIKDKTEILSGIVSGSYDIIAFTSTAEAEAFLLMMEGRSVQPDQVIACFGPYTAANVRKLGLEVDLVAEDYSSFKGFAEAMKQWYE